MRFVGNRHPSDICFTVCSLFYALMKARTVFRMRFAGYDIQE